MIITQSVETVSYSSLQHREQSPTGYRQPLIFQYIYHIKLATLGAYIKFHNILSVKSIISFG